MIKKGDIYMVNETGYEVGCEQHGKRPAVILSNQLNNTFSETVEIVFCTTARKPSLPTHVIIHSTEKTSVVLAEQITTVSKSRLESKIGECSLDELKKIEKAVLISLDISECENQNKEDDSLSIIQMERDTYKQLYDSLLDKVLGVNARRNLDKEVKNPENRIFS